MRVEESLEESVCSVDCAALVTEFRNGIAEQFLGDWFGAFDCGYTGDVANGHGLGAIECEKSLFDMVLATGTHHSVDFKCRLHLVCAVSCVEGEGMKRKRISS